MHVLYVDDNPTNRDELEEQLDFIAPEWQFTFASTIEEAERELQSDTINALITRADVDGSDADSLLKLSSEVHPAAIRVLVEEVHRTRDIFLPATLAHQYLLAPVDPVQLVSAVQRLKDLQSEIYSDALQNIIIRIGRLPSLPALYSEIIREISHPSGTLDNVGKIITRDVAMSAKILQLSNSPFFGFTTRIMDLSHAVFVLGMNTITGLVLTNGIFSDIKVSAASGVDPERLMEHSTDVALVARATQQAAIEIGPADRRYGVPWVEPVGRRLGIGCRPAGRQRTLLMQVERRVLYGLGRPDITEPPLLGAHLVVRDWRFPVEPVLDAV